MSEATPTRAVPFFCPYCGEEDLRPHAESVGDFHCASCDRYFGLRFIGVGGGVGRSG